MPTYTVPTSRSTGYLVTATNWNDELVGNMLYFKDAPVFDTAAIIGAATTNGIRLDIESGSLAVREGDDSGYGPLLTGALTVSGALTTSGMTITGALTPTTDDGGALGVSGTAWSDLFLASGGVINFAAGDTTITHTAGKLTIAGSGAGALDVKGAILPTANDGAALGASGTAWSDLFLASGGVLNFAAGDTTITHATGKITIGGSGAGTVDFKGRVAPTANDGAALGVSGTAWADLFLASGGVIDFAAGDTTITHTTGKITIGGSGAGAVDVKGRIAPTADDGAALGVSGTAWADLFLASGGVINFAAGETTITHSAGKLTIAGSGAGAIDVQGAILPTANDGAALGASGTAWADLFLASGGVLNFAASEATITHSAANTLSFGTSGSERLRITSGGNVAIAATAKLFLDGVAATGDTYFHEVSGNTIALVTGGTERLRVNSSGRLLLNLTTDNMGLPMNILRGAGIINFSDTVAPELYLRRTRGSEATPTAVATNDELGSIFINAYGGTNYRSVGLFRMTCTDYTSDTNMTTAWRFYTTNAGSSVTERFRISGTGDVAIGSGAKLLLDSVFAGGDTYLTESAANTISVFTGGTERLTINSSGFVGIGTTSPSGSLEIASNTDGNMYVGRYTTDAFSPSLVVRKARGTVASPTAIATNDFLGSYLFQGFGGTNWRSLAQVYAYVSNYTSDTNITSYLGFSTTNAGSSSTERLRIAGNGDISIGATAKWFLDGVGGGDTYLTETAANQIAIFTGGSERLRLDGSGNVGVNVTSFGTSAAGVLGLKNGTEPSSGPADTVQFYSVDRSAGNTIPAVYCEGSGVTNAGITSTTVTHKIALKVNGTVYYLLATTNAT